eukprot:3781690-Alexandrium_andersonii.AAC.1
MSHGDQAGQDMREGVRSALAYFGRLGVQVQQRTCITLSTCAEHRKRTRLRKRRNQEGTFQ